MPNHITNNILLQAETPEETEELLNTVKGEKDQEIDFNKVIPMPTELIGSQSPATIIPDDQYEEKLAKAKEEQRKYKEKNPERDWFPHLPISQSMSDDMIKRYGANNWYDWSVKNWGTKWNAYEINIADKKYISFQTAWSHPDEVVKKLSEMFPKITFYVSYADEDSASQNKGVYKMKAGEMLAELNIEYLAQEVLAESIYGGDLYTEQLDDEQENTEYEEKSKLN